MGETGGFLLIALGTLGTVLFVSKYQK